MAHELGDDSTEQRLRDHAEEHFEPRFFGEESTRFGYFFGWGEDYPRGQQNGMLMLTELGTRGSWSRVFNAPDRSRFAEPTVEGIDYPSLGIALARNDLAELRVRSYAATPSHAGRPTTWRVTRLPDAAAVRITCGGQDFTAWTTVDEHTIELRSTIGDHDLRIRTGYDPDAATDAPAASQPRSVAGQNAGPAAGPGLTTPPPMTAITATRPGCSCC